MTTEQKAKAYDEAYKRVAIRFGSNVADELFPELKESEDEKIRKALIGYFKHHKHGINIFYGIKGDDILAWLEKQGEPMEINPTEFDTRLQALIGKFDSLPKEELIGSLSFWMNVVQNDGTYKDEEKQGEQKPAWNEEDEMIALSIEQVMNCASLLNIVPEKIDKIRTWLKSLKERCTWKPSDEQLKAIKWIMDGDNPENWTVTLTNLYNDLKKLSQS